MKEVLELEAHLKCISNLLDTIPLKRKEIKKELENCEKQEIDILHYIELEYDPNDMVKGQQLANSLKEVLLRRRVAKDNLGYINNVFVPFSSKIGGKTGVEKIVNKIECSHRILENRSYVPRILNDLFATTNDK